jgi:purine-binding chemotaxis protein CheW
MLSTTKTAAEAEQYLTFRLDGLDYGIPIIKVQEIRGWTKVTSLPNSPQYIKGVLNLRGTIVPIIDLRLRFGLKDAAYDGFTVIIVINVAGRLAGAVVDAVSDVVNLTAEQRRAAPEFDGQANRLFVQALAQVDEKLLVLLDVDKLINPDALTEVAAVAA